MNKMIVSNLLHRPVRSLITIVAVALEVTLILLMVGLATGLLGDYKQRQEGIGGDVVVQPPNASILLSFSSASMSVKVGGVLLKLPHVTSVTPIVAQVNPGTVELIFGIDLQSFETVGGPFHFLEGGAFQHPDDVIVDEYFAAGQKAKVGDTITVLNHPFRICGIVEQGRGARKFIQIGTMQEMSGTAGKASIFFVKLDNPANAAVVVHEIKTYQGMQNYAVRTMRDYLSMFTVSNLPGLPYFISVVIGVAVVIGFIVIFQAMYTAVMERTREIGILKSLGASRIYIMNVVVRETLLLTIVGIAVGIGVSYAARVGILKTFPTLRLYFSPPWLGYATVIAIAGAILGAIYPAIKAARKDPIDALAYE